MIVKFNNKPIGILGGSFDPPHVGHLKIANYSLKKLNLKKIYWLVTKKNPLKKKPFFSLEKRIKLSKNLVKNIKKINVVYFDNKVRSSKTIKLLKFLIKREKSNNIYLIIGSDNIINFKKWHGWDQILQLSRIVVFSRKGFDQKALKIMSTIRKKSKNILFIKNQKIDISSSKIRDIIKKN